MFSLQTNLFPSPTLTTQSSTKTLSTTTTVTATLTTRRRAIVFNSSVVVASWLNLLNPTSSQSQQLQDELQQQEDHLVQLFQETSPSVVSIKDIELTKDPKKPSNFAVLDDDEDAKVEGTGSGFIWDKFGHIVAKFSNFESLHRIGVLQLDSMKIEPRVEEENEFSMMSNEDLNKRVEEFIQKFNKQIRLQASSIN